MRAVIIDPPFPQLTMLGSFLAGRGDLTAYIHPFLDRNGSMNGSAARIPVMGKRLQQEFERRAPAVGISPEVVHMAGTSYELARYGLHHVQRISGRSTRTAQKSVIRARNQRLSAAAVSHLMNADTVIASFGTALEAFRAAGPAVLKVLDYPIAYYKHGIEILEVERRRRPAFAASLQGDRIHPADAVRLDAECAMADVILVGSEFVRSGFIQFGFDARKVVVVPYGADLSLFHPEKRTSGAGSGFDVLFVGQIGQRKGVADLLDAYRDTREPNWSLRLVGNFVGSPADLDSQRDLFTHIHHLSRAELAGTYRSASVFVLPSHVEGMPLVVLEAMASGVPAIVSDRGPNQVVRNGIDGFVVPAGDVGALAERLRYLAANPIIRKTMAQSAAERAREFSWDVYANRVLQVLEEAR